MGFRWLLLTVVVALMLLPVGDSGAVTVSVGNSFPEYILEDHINLTGRATNTSGVFTDDSSNNFNQGTVTNLTVDQGSVVLRPYLDVAIQNNGNAVLSPGTGTAWDTVLMDSNVLKHNGTYWMYYTGSRSTSLTDARHIGLATSTDGVSWTKYAGNPVLRSRVDSYDRTNIMQPVVFVENGTFHMLYAGNHGNNGGNSEQDIDICYANSSDGRNWTKYASNPVLKNSPTATDWDGLAYRPGDVVKIDDNYLLYLKGVGSTGGSGPKPKLGLFYSKDLKTWTEEPKNPLYVGSTTSWEQGRTNYMTVEMSNDTFRIWTHSDGSLKVGWMWSDDGIDWADSGSSLIDPTAGTIYSSGVQYPRAIKDGDHYDLWITCKSGTNVIGLFKVTPKRTHGVFTSRVLDTRGNFPVTGVTWTTTTPGGSSVQMFIRWTNDTSDWPSWTPLRATSRPIGVTGRYLQYRAELRTPEDWNHPSLDRFQLTYTVPVTRVEVSVDGGPWQTADGTPTDWYENVSLHDGDYDVRVRATDGRGDTALQTIPVKVDLFPPTGGILIEEGRYAHNSTQVRIDVAANDTHWPVQMQLSRQPDFAGATWIDHIPSATYGLLGSPEGEVTIYLRLRDDAGRVSETYNDTIVIDTTSPEGRLLINDGAKYTNSTTVTLSLEWTDITGVVGMMVSNDPDFEGAIWQDPMDAFSWAIGETDGVHEVYARIVDFVGWETVLTDDIILDRTPPAASLSIDRDAPYTTSRNVMLNVTLYDVNPISYKLADLGEPWPGSWRSTGSPVDVPWTLPEGADGQRTVMMLVRDAAGNEFIAVDTIVLDTTPPEGQVLLEDGEPFTTALILTANLSASDATSGLDRMRVSDTDDFSDASWQSVKTSFTWPISPGDGTKTVFVQLRDLAGLVTTIDASIILDTTPPDGTVTIEGVGEHSTASLVELVIDFQDAYGLDAMMVSADPGFPDAVWVPESARYPWDLGDVEGEVSVHVRVRDLAGNAYTATVGTTLDLTDPQCSVVVPLHTMARTVAFTWSAGDGIGLDRVWWSLEDGTSTTVPLEGATAFAEEAGQFEIVEAMTPGDAEEYDLTLVLHVRDLAGREAATSAVITYVPEAPAGALSIAGGAEWTNVTGVEVGLSHVGGLSPTHFRLAPSEAGLADAGWVEWRTSAVTDLDLPGGERVVWGQLRGRFDILSEPFSDTIGLDVLAPVVEIVSPTAASTEEDAARLSISVADDQDAMPHVEWRTNGGEWRTYGGDERVSLKEGDNLIEVKAWDAAGNVGTAQWTISSERGFSVGGTSWLVLVVLLVVAGLVGVWYWRGRGQRPEDAG